MSATSYLKYIHKFTHITHPKQPLLVEREAYGTRVVHENENEGAKTVYQDLAQSPTSPSSGVQTLTPLQARHGHTCVLIPVKYRLQ